MKMKYLLIIPFLITGVLASDLVYRVDMDIYKNDSVVFGSVEVIEGIKSHFTTSDAPYQIKLFAGQDELFSGNILLTFGIMTDPPFLSYQSEKENFYIRLPYYSEADNIKLFHSGREIYSINLNEEFCNKNGVCDIGESKYNCAVDCKKSKLWLLFLIPMVVLIVILILKKTSSMNKLKQQNQNMNS